MSSPTTSALLRTLDIEDVRASAPLPIDDETRRGAREIVDRVREGGEAALRECTLKYDGRDASAPLVYGPEALTDALESLAPPTRALLERTAARIRTFADAQAKSLAPLDVAVPGGRAGHDVVPVAAAGCYAPGGRYPLPSSVLMTAVTARAAGVARVIVASPNPEPIILGAAAIAGADMVLAAGGAHGIGALASGIPGLFDGVDLIVGPGNRWVTAAKELVAGAVGIDLPAGPSELCVLADDGADPDLVAADLLAQAEHDPDARPTLIALSSEFVERVNENLSVRLAALDTRAVAAEALSHGFAAVAPNMDAAIRAVDALAPEHLQICAADPAAVKNRIAHFGGAFLGEISAEVFGDYGVGPNHVLPTGGAARYSGGLSVFTFLRIRTWLTMTAPSEILGDCAELAGIERLSGHRAAAEARAK